MTTETRRGAPSPTRRSATRRLRLDGQAPLRPQPAGDAPELPCDGEQRAEAAVAERMHDVERHVREVSETRQGFTDQPRVRDGRAALAEASPEQVQGLEHFGGPPVLEPRRRARSTHAAQRPTRHPRSKSDPPAQPRSQYSAPRSRLDAAGGRTAARVEAARGGYRRPRPCRRSSRRRERRSRTGRAGSPGRRASPDSDPRAPRDSRWERRRTQTARASSRRRTGGPRQDTPIERSQTERAWQADHLGPPRDLVSETAHAPEPPQSPSRRQPPELPPDAGRPEARGREELEELGQRHLVNVIRVRAVGLGGVRRGHEQHAVLPHDPAERAQKREGVDEMLERLERDDDVGAARPER